MLFSASVAIAVAMTLAGCGSAGRPVANSRHMHPLSEDILAELQAMNMRNRQS